MSDTQDTLIEQVARAWASIDGKAELFDSEKEADGYGTGVYMGYVAEADELLKRSGLATALADSDAKIAELREHSHQRAEDLRTLAAQVAELTQKLERATEAVEFVARWAWRTDPPNASGKLADSDRLSCIKHHPVIKKAAEPHIELAEQEARALQNKEQANG